jgi:hypothetical protein
MRILPRLLLALAVAATISPGLADAEPGVTEVVVHGHTWSPYGRLHAKIPGPGMWKLTRGRGTVWVIGVLEEAPQSLTWDDRFLKQTLQGARTLITPGLATSSDEGETRYRKTSMLPGTTTLSAVVSADTYGRLTATVAREKKLTLDSYSHFTAQRAGTELYGNVLAWHGIDSDMPQVYQIVDMVRGTPTTITPALHFDADAATDRLLGLDTAQSEACLVAYLDGIDYDLDTLPQVATSWSQGDVMNVSLFYHDTPGLACNLLIPNWQATVETATLAKMTRTIDVTLDQPGHSVAVMPFDYLLRKGGILDQLHDRGVEIAPAE